MKKKLFVFIVFLSQLATAKITDFNTLIQAETNAQKEIHNSLNEDIQVVEISSSKSPSIGPEIIILGAGQLPGIEENLAQKNQFEMIKPSLTQVLPNPIQLEQNQFKRLGEELSDAQ